MIREDNLLKKLKTHREYLKTLSIDELIIVGIPDYNPLDDCDGFFFCKELAEKAIGFIENCCTHTKGALAGTPLILEPWQKAIVGNIFGWIDENENRRYRQVFGYVPRKNGKSLFVAAIANTAFHIDGENGAEVYCAAADKGQAALVWDMCMRMHLNEPEMESRVKIFTGSKSITKEDGSFIRPISRDADTKHGFNTHVASVDELHVHKDGELLGVLETSMGAREQPLLFMITTADYNRPSICNTTLEYARNVRDGVLDDPRFLPVIYEADLKDDIQHPHTWYKANPNLGVSFSEDFMADQARKARNQPTFENTFKRLYLNIVTEADVRWLSHADWLGCGEKVFNIEELEGEVCYGGLDLASISDLCALALWFPKQKALFVWHWAPEKNAIDRQKKDRVPYLTWRDQGYLDLTPGNTTDYDYIIQRIVELSKRFDIKEVGFDPYNARQTALTLVDDYGIDMVEFRQGFLSMNEPCKEFERMVLSKTLHHNNNPIVTWESGNVVVDVDPTNSYKPNKKKSTEKIDGIVAAIMAIGCAMTPDESQGPSIYEERGVIELG